MSLDEIKKYLIDNSIVDEEALDMIIRYKWLF